MLKLIFSHICFHNSFKSGTEDLNWCCNWKQKQVKHAVYTQAMTRQIKPRQKNSSTTTAVAGMQYSLWLEQAVQRFTAVIKLCLACRWKWTQCLLWYMSIHVVHAQNIISYANHSGRCSMCFTNQGRSMVLEWMMQKALHCSHASRKWLYILSWLQEWGIMLLFLSVWWQICISLSMYRCIV